MENAQRVFGFMLGIWGCSLGFLGWPALYYHQNESLKREVESLKAERVELNTEKVELHENLKTHIQQVQNASGALTVVYNMLKESGDTTLIKGFESLLKKE